MLFYFLQVQPNSTRHTLQTMMSTLQAECPKLSEADAPTNPASGELYTVYYDKDASWYRYVCCYLLLFNLIIIIYRHCILLFSYV